MKKVCGLIVCIFFIILSCNTTDESAPSSDVHAPDVSAELPDPVPVEEPEDEPQIPEKNPAETEVFDPESITQEVFDEAKSDVQLFIEKLNQIIRDRDYHTWAAYLSRNYINAISDPGFLTRLSESARLKAENIVLKSPEDYFLNVVVPSRANDRVDDIEIIGKNQVKAYTITPRGQRLRLYSLEKDGDSWKIIE